MERTDILIRGGTALTSALPDGRIVENAEIGIRNGRILFVREGGRIPPPPAGETIEAAGCLVIPGLVNTHAHLPMVCFRGLADDLPLSTWLSDHIFPAESRFVTPAFCAAGARLALAESLMAGTTTVCDAYFFPGAIARGALDAGIRMVICAGFADFAVPGIPDPSKNAMLAEGFLDRWSSVSERLTPALFCHAPYTCSAETMRTIKAVARRRGARFMTHLAETASEVEESVGRHGATPLRYLDRLGILDEETVLVHCIWLDDEEIAILAQRGARVSHNPHSSMKLAAGVAPVPAMLKRDVTVGLGTDGAASNNTLDLFGEMRMAAGVHRHVSRHVRVMDSRAILRMATIDGARVLGLDGDIGSLEVGKRADIVLVDGRAPRLTPAGDPFEQIVTRTSAADVTTVIIDGTVVMRDRTLTAIDVGEAMEQVRREAASIAAGYRGPDDD